jgi:D-alanine-D-alanine ligase
MGGISAEREISLKTGAGVHQALKTRHYDAVSIDWAEGEDPSRLLREAAVDVVWLALHGTYGEDGSIQGLLETLRIPYTGSGVSASAAAMEKTLSKMIFERREIPTPAWDVAADSGSARVAADRFGYPVVIKPSREGSTVGVSIVKDNGGVEAAFTEASRCHGATMVEQYIHGHEVSVGILNDAALGTVEIRPLSGFYDYKAKYLSGDTEYLVPAPLGEDLESEMNRLGLLAHQSLGCSGHSRVDMRVSPDGAIHVLEVNTLPGMTEVSLLPKIAGHAGIDYETLVEQILESASLKA